MSDCLRHTHSMFRPCVNGLYALDYHRLVGAARPRQVVQLGHLEAIRVGELPAPSPTENGESRG